METWERARPGSDGHDGVNISDSERWASFLLGGMLTLFGVGRRSVGGALIAVSGVSLVHRALTGHCAVYDALGLDSADTDLARAAPRPDPADESPLESFQAGDPRAWTPAMGERP